MIGYTTYSGGIDKIKDAPALQLTLNGRITPGKRNSLDLVKGLCEQYPDKQIIIHYDFLYIISRFAFFALWLQKAIIEECYKMLTSNYPNFKGIVMHTDYSFSKDVLNGRKSVAEYYNKGIWESTKIADAFQMCPVVNPVESSIRAFYEMFFSIYPDFKSDAKVFVENSVHSGPVGHETSVFTLVTIIDRVDPEHRLFGICYDSEHQYGLQGTDDYRAVVEFIQGMPHIVHLNTVPPEVKACSGKDRHSDTTLWECTIHDFDYYKNLIDSFPATVFIREIKDDAIEREFKSFEDESNRGC